MLLSRRAQIYTMLITRIITAIVLLIVLAVLVSLSDPLYFVLFISLASAVLAYEWLRMTLPSKAKEPIAAVIGIVLFIAFVLVYWLFMSGEQNNIVTMLHQPLALNASPWATTVFATFIMLQFFISFIWIFLIPMTIYMGNTSVSSESVMHSLWAIFAVCSAWFAILATYLFLGAWFLLSFLIIIWAADIFAYFGGRYFGGAKLAPAVSPGKTRSGALCGMLAVTIWMLVSAYMEGSFAALILRDMGLAGVVGIGLVMAVVSIAGDLYESLIKRRANVKDSSQLLPGHGGVWDRLDSVIAVSPLAMCFVFLFYLQ